MAAVAKPANGTAGAVSSQPLCPLVYSVPLQSLSRAEMTPPSLGGDAGLDIKMDP